MEKELDWIHEIALNDPYASKEDKLKAKKNLKEKQRSRNQNEK